MRIVLFTHSLLSDWNHGNAHFLRGVATELLARGHEVRVYEPENAWSLQNLLEEHGTEPLREFQTTYPALSSIRYLTDRGYAAAYKLLKHRVRRAVGDPLHRYPLGPLDLDRALEGADLVVMHEWNDHDLVRRVGEHRCRTGHYRLLFHDTHHRSVTAPKEMANYDLSGYDGVLAFGNVIRDLYLRKGWAKRAWTWHEAADPRVFHPKLGQEREGDLVWIGNWGDEERTKELHAFLLDPVRDLKLKARVHGVRYPAHALRSLSKAGIEYGGWLPNAKAPEVFARYGVTVHVPRRPYVENLPGIPTIRVFEALACGIPLVCSPWKDAENLFTPGEDYLVARNGEEMKRHLKTLLQDEAHACRLAEHGLQTIRKRHTCAHRVDELLSIHDDLRTGRPERTVNAM